MVLRFVTKSVAPSAIVIIITSIVGIGYFAAMLGWFVISRLTDDGRVGVADVMVTATTGLGIVANIAFAACMISRLRAGASVAWGGFMILWACANAAIIGSLIPMTLHADREKTDPSDSFVVLNGFRNMTPVTGNGVSMGARTSKSTSDMTVSMYVALDPVMIMELNATMAARNSTSHILAAEAPLIAKIPLLLIGLNKKYYDVNAQDVVVRSPVIYMIIERGKAPYFEVDFNHLEAVESDPSRSMLMEQNACFVVDKYTARCRFVKNSPLIEGEHTLMKYWDKGYGRTQQDLETDRKDSDAYCHSIVFVFSQQMMPVSSTARKFVHTTRITIYVNNKAQHTLQFPGQMNMNSTMVMPLPSNLFVRGTGVNDANLRKLLKASFIADVRLYKRSLSDKEATSADRQKRQLNSFPITTTASLTDVVPIAEDDPDVNNDVYMEPGLIANSFRAS